MVKSDNLWTCPKCGGQFFQKNLWHSCTKYSEEEFLQGKSEWAIDLYKFFLGEYQKIGPIKLHIIKSRIAFMVLVRFSGINKLGKDFIEGAFWLKEKRTSPKFHKIEFIPKDNYIHRFRIYSKTDIDDEFKEYMKMAYDVGLRKHIKIK
jgi:Domain of unknown function (DUF5655)